MQPDLEDLHKMITKKRRLAIIMELVNTHTPSSQGKLLKLLHDKGFAITQTTLSRDIKQLKISKMPDEKGNYIYMAPSQESGHLKRSITIKDKHVPTPNRGFVSFEFSYQLGVIKTLPGFTNDIALDINSRASSIILGTVTGDDTLLLIPREGVTKEEILDMLVKIIPGFKRDKEREELKITK